MNSHLWRYDVVSDVPDTSAIIAAGNGDVKLSVISDCNSLHFSCSGTDQLVKLLITFLVPDHIPIHTDRLCLKKTRQL